jgi:23S rRNA pseudouridine1911/1915/1917 synthase
MLGCELSMTVTTSPKTVTEGLDGPLDRAVRALFGATWGKARDWIVAGKVQVDGTTTVEPTYRVRIGAAIGVDVRARRPRPGELERDAVVYVDAHVVVVAKPTGISTVPYDERETDTLDARVRAWIERTQSGAGGSRPNLGVVHRLDKETSGLVVFTRTWLAKQHLAAQFRKHTVERRYVAVAHGDVRSRTFRTWFVENRGDGLRGSARGTPPNGAREAITHVDATERLEGATVVGCRLETGRTHQIRIHLSEAGHPLLGDRVYTRHFAGPVLEAPRLLLHAVELGFEHPASGRTMRWSLPEPDDLKAAIERLRRGRRGR